MPRSAIPGAIDTLHLYPRPVLVVALHITDRSTRDDIVATPCGDLFNHLRHGPMTMFLSGGFVFLRHCSRTPAGLSNASLRGHGTRCANSRERCGRNRGRRRARTIRGYSAQNPDQQLIEICWREAILRSTLPLGPKGRGSDPGGEG